MDLSVYSENFAMIYWYSCSVTGTIMQLMNNCFSSQVTCIINAMIEYCRRWYACMHYMHVWANWTEAISFILMNHNMEEVRILQWFTIGQLPVHCTFIAVNAQCFCLQVYFETFSMSKFLGASIPTYEHIWLALEHD